jgi:hypothetical protein
MSEQSCSGRCESRPPLFQLDWDWEDGSSSGACQASQFHLDVMTKASETLLMKASFSASSLTSLFPKPEEFWTSDESISSISSGFRFRSTGRKIALISDPRPPQHAYCVCCTLFSNTPQALFLQTAFARRACR